MRAHSAITIGFASTLLVLSSTFTSPAIAQDAATKISQVSDAQVESNVLQALAANAQLATQTISSTAVYGTVTLSGSVPDEATRALAEQTVSRVAGVKKVVDELTLGGQPAAAPESSPAPAPIERGQAPEPQAQPAPDGSGQGTNPYLQSDGTIANPDANPVPSVAAQGAPDQMGPPPYPAGPPQSTADNYPPAQSPGQNRPDVSGQSSSRAPSYPSYGYPGGPVGAPPPPNAGGAYGPYGNRAPYPPYARRPTEQRGGEAVTLPQGVILQVRTTQRIDSRSTPAGTPFTATVMSDVYAGSYIAIPRGAEVTGVVSSATASGTLKGRGELALQLTSVTLEGRSYPITSDSWAHTGSDKTLRTVNSAVGLGALGAIIGGVAGGGPGAAIGAGVGGVAGISASAASQGGQVIVPAEAILSFHLTQPAQLYTVSQAELNRLGAGVPYGVRRRYPPPPPYAYGPYAYPGYPRYAYPYPY